MLNAVAGKIPRQHLTEGFEHQVLVSMCMVVVSARESRLAGKGTEALRTDN